MELHRADEFGDQEVEVGIALAVGVGAHVDRNAVHEQGDIGAVVEVEPAQEELVGLPLPRMLGDDQAGHRLQHLAGAGDGPGVDLRAGDDAAARRFHRLERAADAGHTAGVTGAGREGGGRRGRLARDGEFVERDRLLRDGGQRQERGGERRQTQDGRGTGIGHGGLGQRQWHVTANEAVDTSEP